MLAATALVLLMTPALGLFYAGPRALEEHAQHVHDVRRRARGRDRHVGARRLLARLRRGRRPHRRPRPRVPAATSTFEPRDGTTIPHLLFMAFQATLLHHHRRARLGRGRRADALRRRSSSSRRCGRCSSTPCSRTGPSAAAGCRRTARSTSPAASRSRWAPASRRSRPRSSSARARTTGARRCCRTTPSTCCSAPACCGSAGSASTAAAASRPATPSVLAFTNTLLTPACTLVVWFVLDLLRGRQVTAIGAATAIIVGCVGITPAGGFISPGWAMVLGALAALPELRRDRLAPAHARRRDARRARRARHRGPHRHPLHRLLRAGVAGTASPTACSTATPTSSATRRSRCSRPRPTRSR